jgi:hypothetical protein
LKATPDAGRFRAVCLQDLAQPTSISVNVIQENPEYNAFAM